MPSETVFRIQHDNYNSSDKDTPDSKVHGANMGPTWVMSAPDGPHVGHMNLAIKDNMDNPPQVSLDCDISEVHNISLFVCEANDQSQELLIFVINIQNPLAKIVTSLKAETTFTNIVKFQPQNG